MLVALVEMAVRSGVGFQVARLHGLADLFGESPGRVVVCVSAEAVADVEAEAARPASTRSGSGSPPETGWS